MLKEAVYCIVHHPHLTTVLKEAVYCIVHHPCLTTVLKEAVYCKVHHVHTSALDGLCIEFNLRARVRFMRVTVKTENS